VTKLLQYFGSLFYCDGVQVFEARDTIGGNYVGVMVGDSQGGPAQYAIVGVNPHRLQEFRLGKIDLGSIMRARPNKEWFLGSFTGEETGSFEVVAEAQTRDIPTEYFPDDGFLLSMIPQVDSASVLRESISRNTLALEITLESSTPSSDHRIDSGILGGFLLNYQSSVKHIYRKAASALADVKYINRETGPLLDVAVPAMSGSFRILLIPSQQPWGLFKSSEVSRALDVIDEFLLDTSDPQQTLERVRKYAGHAASSFVRLIKFLVESDVSLSYSWASPDRNDVSVRGLSRHDAVPLLDILSNTESLNVEKVAVSGRLRKVDLDSGAWNLLSDDGTKYSGKSRDVALLSNLTSDKVYVFQCEEVVEEITGTGREIRTLYVTRVSH